MKKPLEIFLFKSCNSKECNSAYEYVFNNTKSIGKTVAEYQNLLSGCEINVIIGDGRVVRGLNKRFRGVDQSTDVLVFPLEGEIMGEIWLCPSVIQNNAQKFNQPFEKEVIRVLIHGLLHLSGMDHKGKFVSGAKSKEQIFILQEKILVKVI